MRNIFTLMTCAILLINLTACASPSMKLNISVLDSDSGLPIENAKAEFLFRDYHAKAPGMGWGTTVVARTQEKKTSKEGFVTAKGSSNDSSVAVTISRTGYYESYPGASAPKLTHNKLLNRWEPWPCEVTVKLKKIKDPVEKYYSGGGSFLQLPEKGKPVGFDMLNGDWVTPHGNGIVADFTVKLVHQKKIDKTHIKCTTDFTFQSKYDGMQEYQVNQNNQSSFVWPFLAPELGYSTFQAFKDYEMVKESHRPQGRGNNFRGKKFLIRIRTKRGQQGNIISAYYGNITNLEFNSFKNTISFSYKINPNNKSRSLEFPLYSAPDDKDNLLRDVLKKRK